MNPDEFEQRLRKEAFRPIPDEWRPELLREALLEGAAAASRAPSPFHRLGEWLCDWLWPAPAAWAALAVCWVAVVILNRSALPSAVEMAEAQANARLALAYQAAVRGFNALQLDDPAPAPKPPEASPPRRPEEPNQARMHRQPTSSPYECLETVSTRQMA